MRYATFLFGFLFNGLAYCQMNIQWQKTMGGSYFDEPAAIRQTPDGGYIICGETASNDGDVFGNHGGADTWIVKLNSAGAVQWKKILGGSMNDDPNVLELTSDGGYIFAGNTSSNDFDVSGQHGLTDGWVVKLASNGAIQWQKTMGGSKLDFFEGIVQLPDGGYFISGHTKSSDGDLTNNKGLIDLWVVRLDQNGNTIWSKNLGGSGEDLGRAVTIDPAGNLVVAGETLSVDGDVTYNHGNDDFWVIKLTPSGEIIWQQTYGGLGADVPFEIHATSDHGYIVIGYTGSYESGQVISNTGKGGIDCWVIKIDSIGILEWQHPLGGNEPDYGRSIVELEDGSFIAACLVQSSNGDISHTKGGQDAWLAKLSATGALIWDQSFGGTMPDACVSVTKTNDSGLAFAGYTWSEDGDLADHDIRGYDDYWIVKLSPESVSANEPPGSLAEGMMLYPNPATESVYLQIPNQNGPVQVRIFDFSGRKVLERELPNDGQLKTENLPNGIYSVNATTATGRSWSSTLLIRHEE